MIAALRGSYLEFVRFRGVTEKYPLWFEEEMYECVHMNASRYTFWIPDGERPPDYYEKKLVEDYSVFLRKPDGEIHVTDWDTFTDLYTIFRLDNFINCGIAAFNEDCIEYVECQGGLLTREYPAWFYEYFTEAVHFPQGETVLFYDNDSRLINTGIGPFLEVDSSGGVSVNTHCVFLRNKFGEIKGMLYDDFVKYYDDDPILGVVGYEL